MLNKLRRGYLGVLRGRDLNPVIERINDVLDLYTVTVEIPDISTAGSHWVAVPQGGTIVDAWAVIAGAITGANAIITAEIGGVAVTGFSITVVQAGSAAGDVAQSTPITGANVLAAGQALEIITNGGSTGVVKATVTVQIRR